MTQTRMQRDIPGTIQQITENLSFMLNHFSDEQAPSKPVPVERLKNFARENYQDLFREDIKNIIQKLKTNQALTHDEMSLLRKVMIGDLETYTILETHIEEWIKDIHTLLDDLQPFTKPSVATDPESLLTLQGLCIDLEHTLKDFDNYRYILERVNRFKTYVGSDTQQLTDTQRFDLARMLQEMLQNPLY